MPGPGEKDSAQSEGNFNFDAIVIFLIFSLSFLKSYSPGPGLWVWLNIETDLQSSLPCPMVIPCLGLAWNSEESEYLSGDGDCLLLNENRNYRAISTLSPYPKDGARLLSMEFFS